MSNKDIEKEIRKNLTKENKKPISTGRIAPSLDSFSEEEGSAKEVPIPSQMLGEAPSLSKEEQHLLKNSFKDGVGELPKEDPANFNLISGGFSHKGLMGDVKNSSSNKIGTEVTDADIEKSRNYAKSLDIKMRAKTFDLGDPHALSEYSDLLTQAENDRVDAFYLASGKPLQSETSTLTVIMEHTRDFSQKDGNYTAFLLIKEITINKEQK